jgi:hypothetical protein
MFFSGTQVVPSKSVEFIANPEVVFFGDTGDREFLFLSRLRTLENLSKSSLSALERQLGLGDLLGLWKALWV